MYKGGKIACVYENRDIILGNKDRIYIRKYASGNPTIIEDFTLPNLE
jgi:hypothetical protein